MSITDLPLVSMLKSKLHWHQARQKVLAENVANASTPGFKPRELKEPSSARHASGSLPLAQTSPLHLAFGSSQGSVETASGARFETRPSGNAVSLEDEMLKVSSNQSDYQPATTLYQKSLAMLRTAVSGRGI